MREKLVSRRSQANPLLGLVPFWDMGVSCSVFFRRRRTERRTYLIQRSLRSREVSSGYAWLISVIVWRGDSALGQQILPRCNRNCGETKRENGDEGFAIRIDDS